MSFANITFKLHNSAVTSTFTDLVTEKLAILAKYVGDTAHVEVEVEKITAHQSGNTSRVEVNIRHDGHFYRAEAVSTTFEAALDIVRDELNHELSAARGRKHSLVRRGARKIKEMIRFGA